MTLADKYKDKYSFIVDPEGSDPNNPGDACWQTAWLYFAYCVLGLEDSEFYTDYCCKEWDSDPILAVENFLDNYYKYCCLHDKMITHPMRQDHFSRDQLSPLLLLISAVRKYQPHLMEKAKKILKHITVLDNRNQGSLHSDDLSKDNINNANRYVIYCLCELYDIPYPPMGEVWFSAALKAYHFSWKIGMEEPRSYTIWNNLGLFTALFMHSGKYGKLREYFTYFADNNWGPAYRIVAGKPVHKEDIERYRNVWTEHIDIAQQRGPKPRYGSRPSLDYPITIALTKIY